MSVLKDTADVREKLLRVWKQVDEKKISIGEARLQVSLAHLYQAQIPPVSLGKHDYRPPALLRRQQ